jgi:hypothetical protein
MTAGMTFGLFFVFLRDAGQSGAFWPVVASRLAGFAVIVIAAAATGTRPVIVSGGARLVLATFGSGLLDASANVSYVLATRAGLLGLAVVLTALYPGVTVLFGLLMAGCGIVLVTA